MQQLQVIGTAAAAFSSVCACVAAVIAVITTRNIVCQIQDQRATSTSQSLLSCLDKYLAVMDRLYEGMSERHMETAYDSMRSLVDLIWFELILWREGQIPDEAMAAWLAGRRQQYSSGKPDVKFKSNECSNSMRNYFNKYQGVVSYRNVWDDLVHTGYFTTGEDFLRFMQQVHKSPVAIPELLEEMRKKATAGHQHLLELAVTAHAKPAV